MRLNKSGVFTLTLLLAIWIALAMMYGLFTHFSLGALCMLAQTACILLYTEIQIKYPDKRNTRLLLACLALGITGVSLFNAWYLEDIGIWFQIYVFLFSLIAAYVCIKMLRETIRQTSAR